MKSSHTKYLEPKDIIEIALSFCLFDGSQVYELCKIMYSGQGLL